MRDAFQRTAECQSTFFANSTNWVLSAGGGGCSRVSIGHSGSNLRAYLMVFGRSNHPCRVKNAPWLARRGPYGVVRAFCTCADHHGERSTAAPFHSQINVSGGKLVDVEPTTARQQGSNTAHRTRYQRCAAIGFMRVLRERRQASALKAGGSGKVSRSTTRPHPETRI